jgi:RNA polymerase sigma-54 factor
VVPLLGIIITENVVPDFAIRIVEGELTLNGRTTFMSLKIMDMMQTYKVSTDKSGAQKTLYSLLSKIRFG